MGKTPAELQFSGMPGKSGWMCGEEKVGDTHAGMEKLKMRPLAVKARKTRYKNR